MSIVGCLQSLAVVFTELSMAFSGTADRATREQFFASVAAYNKTPALPPNVIIRLSGGHSLLAMTSRQFNLVKIETWNSKNDKYFQKNYRRFVKYCDKSTKIGKCMWIWTGNKLAKFHGNILNVSENIPKSFKELLFWLTLYVYMATARTYHNVHYVCSYHTMRNIYLSLQKWRIVRSVYSSIAKPQI